MWSALRLRRGNIASTGRGTYNTMLVFGGFWEIHSFGSLALDPSGDGGNETPVKGDVNLLVMYHELQQDQAGWLR